MICFNLTWKTFVEVKWKVIIICLISLCLSQDVKEHWALLFFFATTMLGRNYSMHFFMLSFVTFCCFLLCSIWWVYVDVTNENCCTLHPFCFSFSLWKRRKKTLNKRWRTFPFLCYWFMRMTCISWQNFVYTKSKSDCIFIVIFCLSFKN